MSQVAHRLNSLAAFALAAALVSGCSSNSISNPTGANPTPQTGTAFVVGTDAPLAGVVSFSVQLQSIDAVDSNGNQVPLISGTPTVDFARFNGLQTLLDLNDVPVGTYTSINITLGPATLGYLNTQAGSAPTIQTENATLTTSTIQVPLTSPFVVSQSEPIGLHFDFDLHKSIQVDGNGQITGQVTPTFNLRAVDPSDGGAYIDQFDAAVISADPSGQTFQIQGPHGRQFTVNVNGQTEFDGGTLSELSSSSIVQVSGTIDRADSTIDADEVAILSQDGFYAAGQVTYVQPSSGPATSFDLYVRGLLPTTTGLSLGQIAQVNLSGNESYSIYWMHNPLTQYLFNSSTLVPGQHVAVGGPASGATNPQAVTVKRVTLRHWGYNGTVVSGSVTSGGSFQMNVDGFAGQLVPGTVTVYTGEVTQFRNGLNSINDVSSANGIRVVGLLIRDQSSGQLILLAHYVDALD
jgi:hypothetical protein